MDVCVYVHAHVCVHIPPSCDLRVYVYVYVYVCVHVHARPLVCLQLDNARPHSPSAPKGVRTDLCCEPLLPGRCSCAP